MAHTSGSPLKDGYTIPYMPYPTRAPKKFNSACDFVRKFWDTHIDSDAKKSPFAQNASKENTYKEPS